MAVSTHNGHSQRAGARGSGGLVYVPVAIPREPPVVRDIVCGAEVDFAEMAGELIFEGETYRFCSLRCARQFAQEPERFAAAAPAA